MNRFIRNFSTLNKFSKTITQNKQSGAAQAMLYALELNKEDLKKPQIGIGSVWFESNPCNSKLNKLTYCIKNSFDNGDLLPFRFSSPGVSDGISMGDLLSSKGILSGIKVDKSTHDLALSKGEVLTEGLDGLYERIANYQSQGAEFTKWRAVITIGNLIPTNECIELNAIYLARYALISQEVGLVPIVEPEILMDGDHSINSCYEATNKTLSEVFNQLDKHKVNLSGILLKPNMVLSGKESSDRANKNQVAEMTLKCFKDTIPKNVQGIIFLSGGQSDLESIDNLDAINKLAKQTGNMPWELSFSYGRGLQSSTLNKWNGNSDNVQIAQKEFIDRCNMVSDARNGQLS